MPGVEYKFKIAAVNKWGQGEFSDEAIILSAYKPGQVNAVYTSIDPATGDVVLEWDLPNERGDPIETYTILILCTDGNFRVETQNCDGNDAAIVLARKCQIPMQMLRDAPYDLAFDVLVQVKIYA